MDSTVVAIPVYFGTMGAEYLWLREHADQRGPTPADYERRHDHQPGDGHLEPRRSVHRPEALRTDHSGKGQVRQGTDRDGGHRGRGHHDRRLRRATRIAQGSTYDERGA